MDKFTGYRTILVGLLMAIAPAGLGYLAGIDWSHYFGPNVAFAIAGVITIAMRIISTTPVGVSQALLSELPPKKPPAPSVGKP